MDNEKIYVECSIRMSNRSEDVEEQEVVLEVPTLTADGLANVVVGIVRAMAHQAVLKYWHKRSLRAAKDKIGEDAAITGEYRETSSP